MISKLGNKNMTLLSKMMDLTAAKHRVHAQNVANVNTPNYHRREFVFDKALRHAMKNGRAEDYATIRGWVDRPRNTPVRNNGNNVDIDMEMVEMRQNATEYQIYTNLYTRKATAMKQLLRGVE